MVGVRIQIVAKATFKILRYIFSNLIEFVFTHIDII